MSPPRRRSARLASASKKVKPVRELPSLAEREESPNELPQARNEIPRSPLPTPATPASSALKPPRTEMHPSKFHTTMAEPSSALRLGFTDIKPHKRRDSQHGSGLDSTPSKLSAPSSAFTFRASRGALSTELSSDAQVLMDELRGAADKFKEDLRAQREAGELSGDAISNRPFAKPKGKSNRYSAAHMAEFKKMDSIEGHASAWRAQNGRFTPVKSNLKRSPSKANLDATPTSQKSNAQQSPAKTGPEETPNNRVKAHLKRTSSVANLDNRPQSPKKTDTAVTPSKPQTPAKDIAFSAKRLKQRVEDDASSARPTSRDGSALPRPTFSTKKSIPTPAAPPRLTSPSKELASSSKPTVSLVAPPPKLNIDNLAKSSTTDSVSSPSKITELKRRIMSPTGFQKVKSILRGQSSKATDTKSAIPQPSTSQTPAPPRTEKALPAVPFTTPRRKLDKHVTFTPETIRQAMSQDSPSPHKAEAASASKPSFSLAGMRPTSLNSVLARARAGDVAYPDLTNLKNLLGQKKESGKDSEKEKESTEVAEPPAPGSFTFRSDHTIKIGDVPSVGFGASPGQSSIRHVRSSIQAVSEMPGGFPENLPSNSHPNKENAEPSGPKVIVGALHGMSNKKRHRADSDDEDDADKEATERAGKKRKNENASSSQTSATPRPLGVTPSKKARVDRPLGHTPSRTLSRTPSRTPARKIAVPTPASASIKKRPTFNMSRLNMLAQPKHRA